MKKVPNPTDVHVGSRVRMRRLMLGMSQNKLAQVLGVTFQQVQKYEKGANRISSSRLQQIADKLQVPVTFFFEGGPSEGNATAPWPMFVSEYTSSSDGLRLTKAFVRLKNRDLRQCIVALVEEIAARYPETK